MDNVTLREYFESLVAQHQVIMDARIESLNREIDKASMVLNQKLETMNEFRKQITEERQVYVREIEFDLSVKNIIEDLDALALRVRAIEDAYANFAGRLWMLGTAMTGFSALITIAMSLWFKK